MSADHLLLNNIGCLGTFQALFCFKSDCITLCKGFEAIALDGRIVDKNIATFIARNKSKTFGFIEPFHCSLSHCATSLTRKTKHQTLLQK